DLKPLQATTHAGYSHFRASKSQPKLTVKKCKKMAA
ncbi:unnamed protein product, partial [marine sediment metagenome]